MRARLPVEQPVGPMHACPPHEANARLTSKSRPLACPRVAKEERKVPTGLPLMIAVHVQPPLPVAEYSDPFLTAVVPIGDYSDVTSLPVVKQLAMNRVPHIISAHVDPTLSMPKYAYSLYNAI